MKKTHVLIGVSAAAFLGPFTQTIYTPSLPEMRDYFEVGNVYINLTISLFTAILAVSNFFIGPIADSKGRRSTLLVGLFLYILGSLACLAAPAYGYFLAGRALQAAGISTGSLIAVAVIGDIYKPHERSKAMSLFQMMIFLGPVFGPLIGGFIAGHLHWRWAFALLVVVGVAAWLYNCAQLKETRPHDLSPVGFETAILWRILKNASAASIFLLGFSQFFGYYIFLVYLPGLLDSLFSIPMASRGGFFVPLTAGILAGIQAGGMVQRRWTESSIIGACSVGIGLGVLAFFALLSAGWLTLTLLVIMLAVYGVLLGMSLPVQTTLLVGLFKEERATAIGLYNFCRFAGAAAGPMVGGLVEGFSGVNTVFLALGLLLLLSAWAVKMGLQRNS